MHKVSFLPVVGHCRINVALVKNRHAPHVHLHAPLRPALVVDQMISDVAAADVVEARCIASQCWTLQAGIPKLKNCCQAYVI